MCTISAIAQHVEILRKIFVNDRCNRPGVYGLLLWKDGKWFEVIVDDQFPITKRGQLLFARVVLY